MFADNGCLSVKRFLGQEKGRPLASPQKEVESNFLASAPDHVERHLRKSGKAERTRTGWREIDNPAPHERAPVIDADHDRTAGALVGDPNHGAEWQSLMGGRQTGRRRMFAIGREP